MTLSRINHLGAAASTTLNGSITAGSTSATLSGTVTGYPTTNFVIKIDAGTASEEKILVGSRTGSTLSSLTRGYDGTAASSHSSGAAVEHDLAAVVIDDANDHVYTTSRDDHTQYARTDGTRAITGSQSFSAGIRVTSGGANVTGGGTFDTVTASTGGSTAASRYVGGTTSGAPASGTYAVGDFVIDQTGALWVCTVAGTPGTWLSRASKLYAEMYLSASNVNFAGGVVPYDTGNDPNNNLDLPNHRYTVPVNGLYTITTGIEGVKLLNGYTATVQVLVNGSNVRDIAWSNVAEVQNLYGSTQYYLQAGNLLNIAVAGTLTSSPLTSGRQATYMTISLIAAH